MPVRVVETVADLEGLETPWRRLSQSEPSSIFSSFDYVRLAWQHFRQPGDRLFIPVLSDAGGEVTAIAPFCVRPGRSRGIPHRSIQFIAEWEGDRPIIPCRTGPEAAWREIFSFLARKRRDWDRIELAEQPVDGPEGRGWSCLEQPGLIWEQEPGPVGYYVPASGSWDDYVGRLGSHTRHEWRRHSRRLSGLPGGFVIERIFAAERSREAVDRFIALEQSGWKGEARIGVSKDEVHRGFYVDLLTQLAARDQAATFFLTSGGQDLAGAMLFLFGDVVYFRNVAYSSAFSSYSPGTVLGAEVFRFGFERGCREIDMLGLHAEGKAQRHKTEWAKGLRPTVQLTGHRKTGRLLPLVVARALRRAFGDRRPARG